MNISSRRSVKVIIIAVLLTVGSLATIASANHSWGGYHWARTANPFTLKLGDNVSTGWDNYLGTASTEWSLSTVLDTAIVPGNTNNIKGRTTPKNCVPTSGRVEVCNSSYGANGWLGIASIWINGTHIAQGTVKLNDTYFNTTSYNTPAWRNLVMCQEVAHTFGLAHQDETFNNPNLGSCMDYTNDPDGTLANPDQLDNQFPNQHDYDELAIIYGHADSFNSFSANVFSKKSNALELADDIDTSNPSEWGKVIRKSHDGRSSLFERDLGNNQRVFTFVLWAK